MKKSMLRVAVAAGAVAAAMTPAIASHSWSTYHWAGNGHDLALTVNTAITPIWNASIGTAISDWNKSTELTLTARTAAGVNTKKCDPIAGQILVCNDAYGQRGWLGIASIWLSNGHIVQGTTKLNDSYFNSSFYNTPAWRAAVACQEIGHDFGLDHQDEAFDNYNLGTCMDYSRAPAGGVYNGFDYGPANVSPNAHDFQQLKTIYNHDDGYTSAIASTGFGASQFGRGVALPPSAQAGVGDTPSEWGRPIHRDASGRPDVFVKDLDRNNKVLTHVFWTVQ